MYGPAIGAHVGKNQTKSTSGKHIRVIYTVSHPNLYRKLEFTGVYTFLSYFCSKT